MDEKTLEHVNDIKSSGNVISDCCGASVYLDLCGDCHDHCTAIYEDIECPDCGGSIIAAEFDNGRCQDCGKDCSDIIE
jgi:hypothetical protein